LVAAAAARRSCGDAPLRLCQLHNNLPSIQLTRRPSVSQLLRDETISHGFLHSSALDCGSRTEGASYRWQQVVSVAAVLKVLKKVSCC